MKFDFNTKHKVGDIIFPYDNGTSHWYQLSVWTVITRVDRQGRCKSLKYFYADETASLYSEMLYIKKELKRLSKKLK